MSRDPLGYSGTPNNLFSYAASSPTGLGDPMGLFNGPSQLHHWYPLYLGGKQMGALTELETAIHVKAHQYFQSQGIGFWGRKGSVEAAQAAWKAMPFETRMFHIQMSMRKAGLSLAEIEGLMPAVRVSEATPGVKTIRTRSGFGKTAIPVGLGFSAIAMVLLERSTAYAAEVDNSWRREASANPHKIGVCYCEEYAVTASDYRWYTAGFYDLVFGDEVTKKRSLTIISGRLPGLIVCLSKGEPVRLKSSPTSRQQCTSHVM